MKKIRLSLSASEIHRYYCRCAIAAGTCTEDHSGNWYSADDVDTYRAKVRRLVEAAKMVEPAIDVLNAYRAKVRRLVEAAREIDPAINALNNTRDDVSLAKRVIAWNAVFRASDRLVEAIAEVECINSPK